jgi:hypothetical protein
MAQPAMPIRREAAGPGRSHSASFDHDRRPETLRTAMATAFFCPTNTTSRLPRVNAGVENVPLQHGVVLRHDGDDDRRIFGTLRFVNRGRVGV